jgi:ParB family chromosome partitioning protein
VAKERRLGRGLEALLGRPLHTTPDELAQAPAPTAELASAAPASLPEPITDLQPEHEEPAATEQPLATDKPVGDYGHALVDVSVIDPNPYQPRKMFDDDALIELSDSLQQHGMLQPLVVRRVEDRFELISGDRRLRAAMKAGWTQVPVHVRMVEDQQMAEMAIVENLQRKDLGPLEKAASFKKYLDQYRCTQEELANRLSIDRSTVANLVRLLELPSQVQAALNDGKISMGHGRALLPLGEEPEQVKFCQKIQDEGLSVRATEQLVQETIRDADAEPLSVISSDGTRRSLKPTSSQQLSSLEQEMRSALGAKVDIRQSAKGRGKIVIHFKNHEDFERLRQWIAAPHASSEVG